MPALQAAGLFTDAEVDSMTTGKDLSQVPDADLVAEMTRRMSRPGAPKVYDAPIDNVVQFGGNGS
ncbi:MULTISPECIES: hypothetical protein [unclassified Arthrobacter]|uniref:hypothetical protein n=1 Tax=unclassified Arthrobacter TaxID=235627 RepID=UPI0011B008B5|nr:MULTISPECIES: hypothetical protein [unclassified Arthrobacter]